MNEPGFPGLADGARIPVFLGILAILVTIFVASTVPLPRTASYSATVTNSGDLTEPHYVVYRPPQSGRFIFSWGTVGGSSVTFDLLGPSGEPIYSSNAATGTGHVFVLRSGTYQFGFEDANAETVQVSGTLSYSVPLI